MGKSFASYILDTRNPVNFLTILEFFFSCAKKVIGPRKNWGIGIKIVGRTLLTTGGGSLGLVRGFAAWRATYSGSFW
ncbi:MAG: hypothetical protein OHK0011_07850 [Turneriella sp.]